ncbi:surface antigen-domain-containing protein [Polychytrium aggregatum]|uniref:surface antigen-domain-containing protein n=1 Tax=Polychytrium aggregatum TaxID=110093 RepID=UPI0022FE153B|nr:surface antigen-domain-containing protein [Polychytrium aggregatum]KAI9199824.1 surface antigen-domain-containing protein [Polychytrium aggregatum]
MASPDQSADLPPANPHHERLVNLIHSSTQESVKVNSVRVEGHKYTKPHVLERIVKDVLEAKTLGEVMGQSKLACHRLNRLGIFRSSEVILDTPPSSSGRNLVDVIILVEEAPRMYAKTGTEIGNYEGNMNASINFRNVLGAGETLEANWTYGVETSVPLHKEANEPFATSTGTSYQVLFGKPINANPDTKFELAAFKLNRNMALFSSHEEAINGFSARYKLLNGRYGRHEFQYDASWRHIYNLSKDASWSIRENAGHSLKSSIGHSFTRDQRDDPMLPTKGYYVKLFQEFAGLGGDVRHLKSEVETQLIKPLGYGFSLSGSARTGLLVPLFGDKTKISDRFFLGGPLSIRGFRQSGLGPKDGKDTLGGDAYWAAGLSLLTPLPYLVDKPLRGHLFINGGNLIPVNTQKAAPETLAELFRYPSVSVGMGLAVRFSILRLEINWCLPVAATTTDNMKPGLQFGVGINYI